MNAQRNDSKFPQRCELILYRDMVKFIPFTEDDVKLINFFCDNMGINHSGVTLETNNEKDDTITLGAFCIIKDENNKLQLDAVSSHYSYDSGYDATESNIGEYYSLPLALEEIAVQVTRDKVQGFFESLIPDEPEFPV